MNNDEMIKRIEALGIVPVVRLDRAEDAVPLAQALIAGGLPVAEIARKFGCRQNTVLTKLRRTRLRLSAYLEQEGLQ